jgi:hypothetical protein
MFKINDEDFEIKFLVMNAYVDEDEELLKLNLDIHAPDYVNIARDRRFLATSIFEFKPHEIEKWQDFSGKTVEWEYYPEKDWEIRPLLFAPGGLASVHHGKAELVNKDNQFFVKIKALCDLTKNGEDEKWHKEHSNFPLKIETEVKFSGISFGENKTQKQCEEIINPYLSNIEDLKYFKNDRGSSYLIPKDSDPNKNSMVRNNASPFKKIKSLF